MQIIWEFEDADKKKLIEFYLQNKDKLFVKHRIEKNVNRNFTKITKSTFWHAMASCLLTTQQRSGPASSVNKFIITKPFPLNLRRMRKSSKITEDVERVITNFGGIRRGPTIGKELKVNLHWLDNSGWCSVFEMIDELLLRTDKILERNAAEFIQERLKGFGPKQSRNLLQSLGLTKHETPIDSRIIKWLNGFGFPLGLSGNALSDKHYYNVVMDGFQALCDSCNLLPCVVDAAVFASFDEEWPEKSLIW